jgi:Fur family peroxide stress response transcriptional regulator
VRVDDATVRERLARFKAAASGAGLKLTHQRLEIFREVASSLAHPDAETVFRAVRRRMPTVSLDTVYRTLATLSDLGLVTALSPRRDGVRFDANLDRHHHFVCVRCGLTRDFESAELNSLRVPAVAEGFGEVIAARVEVRGLCERCARTQAGHQMQEASE